MQSNHVLTLFKTKAVEVLLSAGCGWKEHCYWNFWIMFDACEYWCFQSYLSLSQQNKYVYMKLIVAQGDLSRANILQHCIRRPHYLNLIFFFFKCGISILFVLLLCLCWPISSLVYQSHLGNLFSIYKNFSCSVELHCSHITSMLVAQ